MSICWGLSHIYILNLHICISIPVYIHIPNKFPKTRKNFLRETMQGGYNSPVMKYNKLQITSGKTTSIGECRFLPKDKSTRNFQGISGNRKFDSCQKCDTQKTHKPWRAPRSSLLSLSKLIMEVVFMIEWNDPQVAFCGEHGEGVFWGEAPVPNWDVPTENRKLLHYQYWLL